MCRYFLPAPIAFVAAFVGIAAGCAPAASSGEVSYRPDSGLYSYRYSFHNADQGTREISEIIIPVGGAVVQNLMAPAGWTALAASDGATVNFTATEVPEPPPGFVDEGQILPSPFQIAPGHTLAGFGFDSPAPPAPAQFTAVWFAQLPKLGLDVPDEDDSGPPMPPDASFQGAIQAPATSR